MVKFVCESCGDEVDEKEVESGLCADCQEGDYMGPKCCCGAIYEEGEEICASCCEPL
jgi:hypothetical protein